MESVNSECKERFVEYDISHLRRGDPHPWKETHVLQSWLTDLEGKRSPVWGRRESFKLRKWTNRKEYTDTVIILRDTDPPPTGIRLLPNPEPLQKEFRSEAASRSALLANKRQKSRDKNIPFDLTQENLPEIPTHCPVLGIPIVQWNGKLSDHTATLDRIYPSRGYVSSNVIWISHRANRIKTDATWQEIQKVADFYRKLVPDMPESFLKDGIDLNPLQRPPDPPKSSVKVPSPSEWDLKASWLAEEKQWRDLARMDNHFGHALGLHYHQIWKKGNSWEARSARYKTDIKWALSEWKSLNLGRGIFSIHPADLQKELSALNPSISSHLISVFGQLVSAVLKEDSVFVSVCEKQGAKAYRLNI